MHDGGQAFNARLRVTCAGGHCKNLAPEYKKAAAATKGMVNIVAIDCDDASNRPLCGRYDVKGTHMPSHCARLVPLCVAAASV